MVMGGLLKEKKKIAKNRYGLSVATDIVVAESITLLRLKGGFDEAVAFGEKVFVSRSLQIVKVDEGIEEGAWSFFRKYSDKRVRFTVCRQLRGDETAKDFKGLYLRGFFSSAGFRGG